MGEGNRSFDLSWNGKSLAKVGRGTGASMASSAAKSEKAAPAGCRLFCLQAVRTGYFSIQMLRPIGAMPSGTGTSVAL